MSRYRIGLAAGLLLAILTPVIPGHGEMLESRLTEGIVVKKTDRGDVERGFLAVQLPAVLDTVYLDVAELVVTVSTVYDSTEALLIAALPATVSLGSRTASWSEDWTAMTGGFTTESGGLASMLETQAGTEIHIDVTAMVRRWLAGELPNYGVVLKSFSEECRSTFSWIRDGRYDGADAKLVIHYSRLDR